jgi:hypothetical protein
MSLLYSPESFPRRQELVVPFELLPNRRKVIWIGNEKLQIALAAGGGHIASLRFPGETDHINPFWIPPWPSLEPEDVTDDIVDREYGGPPEGRLLASILGHSLALDLYGAPSREEALAGAVTHGKVGVLSWKWSRPDSQTAVGDCKDDLAQLHFSRHLQVKGHCVVIEESLENLRAWDRPIGWQQHVSLGAPFCEEGFWARSNCDLGSTHPQSFGAGSSLIRGRKTEWPAAPRRTGDAIDYRQPLGADAIANDFSAYRVRPGNELGAFVAGNTNFGYALFYAWPRHFFPWMGVWDEKHARHLKPWNKRASVRAYEFGVSPFPLTRRELLRDPFLFDLPTYLILPGAATLRVTYMLGVFSGVSEAGDLVLSADAAALVRDGREVSRVPLAGTCASSKRLEMDRA